jgi:hypothetical protein
LVQYTKMGGTYTKMTTKIYQMALKFTKW